LKRGGKVAAPFIGGRPTLENFDQVRQTTFVDEAAEAVEAQRWPLSWSGLTAS
jgi:hypothetical protein